MKKGISMTALTMYVVVLTIIIGVIVGFNANILGDVNDFVKSTKMYEQYSKFNMFFLEILGENPTIEYISEDIIVVYTSRGSSMIEYDNVNGIVNYVTPSKTITIGEYINEFEFTVVDNTLVLDMSFNIDDVSYIPEDVAYCVGGWVE